MQTYIHLYKHAHIRAKPKYTGHRDMNNASEISLRSKVLPKITKKNLQLLISEITNVIKEIKKSILNGTS